MSVDKNFVEYAKSRRDFALIAKWITSKAKVLDLGCADGALLGYLRNSLGVRGYGVEKDDANWLACMQNGIDVIQMDLEEGLSGERKSGVSGKKGEDRVGIGG